MMTSKQDTRRAEIEAAAYSVLDAKGYGGFSIQAVARAAKASNETLYRWYGDKAGLFEALIQRNAENVLEQLERTTTETQGLARLAALASDLLTMLVGPRSIALNRAAAADATGQLGATLAKSGRERVVGHILMLMEQAVSEGSLRGDPGTMAETFIALLAGDWQVRRVTGAMPSAPSAQGIAARAHRTMQQLCQLFPGPDLDAEAAVPYLVTRDRSEPT